jgi:allantoate deiminase
MRDRAARAIAECFRIAQISEEPGRTTRRFLTPPAHAVHKILSERMQALGMSVHIDAAGNLRGLWQPRNAPGPRLVVGSHVDTVPDAGAFDGVLGVALAIELVEIAQGLGLHLPIEVIAFSEEEGVRFGVPFLGSRAVAGRFDPSLLLLKDSHDITVEQSIRDFGLDPSALKRAAISHDAAAFLEIHIEQGPVLESEDLSLAAVTAIAGQTRMSLEFRGQANHSGTTPMHLRRDALAAAAEFTSAVESLARQTEGLVATVGKIEVEPNAGNVIAGMARISLDVRHAHDPTRLSAVESLLEKADDIASRRGIILVTKRQMDQPAVPMDERLTAFLAAAIESAGLPPRRMPSGAGHDAMVMAARLPVAMLFLRSPGGISHHPAESVREQDVEAALRVGRNFIERLAAEHRT